MLNWCTYVPYVCLNVCKYVPYVCLNACMYVRMQVSRYVTTTAANITHSQGDPKSPMKGEPKGYDKILPVLTQPYDLSVNLRDGRSLACDWEEAIGFDERLQYFNNSQYLFIFELLDFVHTTDDMDEDRVKRKNKAPGKVRKDFWVRIAWSFLRPNENTGGHVHLGRKLRLQLYKYRKFWFWEKVQGKDTSDCQAYWQWKSCEKSGNWKPYKSTLYVTMDGIERPTGIKVPNRSHMPWETEEGDDDLNLRNSKDNIDKRQNEATADLDATRLGSKRVGATGKGCRVPNVPMHKLDSDYRGCFVLAFSTFGTFLACATGGRQMYKIKIFNVANGKLAATLPGHHEIVYDMEWGNNPLEESGNESLKRQNSNGADLKADKGEGDKSADANTSASKDKDRPVPLGKLLLTASADTTAKVWSVETSELVAACHHPSYVYTARFCPGPDGERGDSEVERALSACSHVVTGCYDHNIRLWDVRQEVVGEDRSAQILKVVQGHKSHINSIVIDQAKTKVYSGDGIGQVRVWELLRHSCHALSLFYLPPPCHSLLYYGRCVCGSCRATRLTASESSTTPKSKATPSTASASTALASILLCSLVIIASASSTLTAGPSSRCVCVCMYACM